MAGKNSTIVRKCQASYNSPGVPIDIPSTTLACVDCQYPWLALRALRLSLAQCGFTAVKFFTNATGLDPQDARIEIVPIPRVVTSNEYSQFMVKELVHHLTTDYVQVVQWDGWVINGNAWRPAFQDYDYIGARWWFAQAGQDVGNGGFSLRSLRLLHALLDSEIVVREAEDTLICISYRRLLEDEYGIRIAPAALAKEYAFEGDHPNRSAFGFHRLYNFPVLYEEAELAELFEEIPDAALRTQAGVSLVRRLSDFGRGAEALRYADRLRADRAAYAAMDPAERAELEEVLAGLSAPAADSA